MKIIAATHVYPFNPRQPGDIPGNFLPAFFYELTKRGARVNVLAPNPSGLEPKVADAEVPVTWFDWNSGGRLRNLGQFNPLYPRDAIQLLSLYRNGIKELKQLAQKESADAILACWAVPAGVFAEAAQRALHIPYVVWALGSDIHTSAKNPLLRPLVKRALRGASKLYANSQTLAHAVESLSARTPDFLPTLRRLPDPAALLLPVDRANFLFAGRFEPIKGVALLLDAFSNLQKQNVRAHLYLAGDGSQDAALRAQARALGLDDAVTFLGFLRAAPLAAYLHAVDAVVIPSHAEALPVIFTEAAQSNTPAVVTAVGDLPALAEKYGTALVVPPNDADALARGMIEMAHADKTTYRKGISDLLALFDYGHAAEKLLNDLEQVRRQTRSFDKYSPSRRRGQRA